VVGTLLAGVAGTVLFTRFFPYPHEQWTAVWQSGLSRGLLLMIAAFGLWQLRSAAGSSRPKAIALQAGLVLLVGVDAWTHAPNQNPTASAGVCRPGLVTEKLALEPMLGRCRAWRDRDTERLFYFRMLADPDADYVGRRFGLYGDCNLLDRIPTPDGFYSLYPARQNEIAQALYRAPTNRFPDGLANFLGIAYITNPTNLLVWRTRTNALPLLTVGQQPVFLEPKATLAGIQAPDFDAQRLVYLPPEVRASVSVTNGTAARILSQRVTAHRVTAEIEAKEPSLMVIAQSWYPCWRAYVDGKPVPLWQANYAFQALEVPSGKHAVKLVYRDTAFVVGGVISLLTLAVMG
ncbi:MAG: YfhO family protein, partial [Pedosphaera parvula]|nr:YfhO family protein [Pedosphaera parvula]